jgi:hypothetical protein
LRRSVVGVLALLASACALVPASTRPLNVLKNRTTIPSPTDFDPRVTLEALLQPGNDRQRWLVTRAATIQGYVVAVKTARMESANRFSITRRDTHIEVALSAAAPPSKRVILEVTPPMRDWARDRGLDWSTEALQRAITGRLCRFEGWLLFDTEHVDESENTSPGGAGNWRATAWEIHPVTAITLLE